MSEFPFIPKGTTLLIEPDPLFNQSPIARPDISAGQERPESGIIRAMGMMANTEEFELGERIAFHPSAGHEWSDTEGNPWIILEQSEARLHLPDEVPDAPS